MSKTVTGPSPPTLWGLVLAGGDSRRMGQDKGRLLYNGVPQARRVWLLLTECCPQAYVAVRPEQAGTEPYAELPRVLDDGSVRGPAAGLLAAWARWPDVAWLVVAADMPLVEATLLADLIGRRNPDVLATAFRHADGTPEPLCTIWEPVARRLLIDRARANDLSLRRLLEDSAVAIIDPVEPNRLVSVDSREDYEATRLRVAGAVDRSLK